jgi:4-amino-4-deoxy-L-arabinose transferase-like glycosyltransferase
VSVASDSAIAPHRATARRWLRAHAAALVCILALLLLSANLLHTLTRKSLTTDEYVHIPAGVAYLRGDFRPNAEHPPLAKLVAALPLTALGATPPPVAPAETPTKQLADAARYFWEANAAQFAAISFWARVPMIAITAALGAAIFAFARAHFGDRAAAFAVLLFALEPTILAHGRVVHTDIPAALGLLGTVAALACYTHRQTLSRAALLGLALGLTLVTKFSMLTLLPPLLVLWGLLCWQAPVRGYQRLRVVGHAATSGVVALLAVHASYGFRRQVLDPNERAWVQAQAGEHGAAILRGLDLLGWLLPPRFLHGVFQQYLHNRDGHPASLLGDYALHGWWYYFPVTFVLKTPLPLLACYCAALGWALWRTIAGRDRRLLWLVGPLACYLAVALTSRINIGIRHLLPLYPFLLILAGVALDLAWRATGRRAITRLAIVPLIGWLALETLLVHPHYLPYMNQLARREPAWSLLSDSNVEWGDDLGALAQFLQERGETEVLGALLGGRDLLAFHGIAYVDLLGGDPPGQRPATRYIAIGTSFLNGSTIPLADGHFRPDLFATFRGRTPEAILGGSIHLYRNEPLPVELAAPLPDAAFRATLRLLDAPKTLRAGQSVLVSIDIRNESDVRWPPAPDGHTLHQIRLGNYWLDARDILVADDARSPLPFALGPGERLRLHLLITAPAEPGEYVLGVDLVQEGVSWFGARGSMPVLFKIHVVPE